MKLFFIFLISFFTLSGCGVKAPPLKDPEIAIDSYIKSYTHEDDEKNAEKESQKQATPPSSVIK